MAATFKTLTTGDVASTRTLLHEAIPVTGTIVSGTYGTENIKNFSHGLFQSVYDYPYLSSSANHIFDLTCGYASQSPLSGASHVQNAKKINIYNEMAQMMVGFDETGSVRRFDEDGDYVSTATKINDAYFLNLTRLLTKDEIKKGSFSISLGVHSSSYAPYTFSERVILQDTTANTSFKINSPVGEYGILYATNESGSQLHNDTEGTTSIKAGLIFYQAGICVITGGIFGGPLLGGLLSQSVSMSLGAFANDTVTAALTGSAISGNCDDFRHRIYNLSFNNTTELNSTVYFCRANHNEFNYSSNPTYLSASKMVIKNNATDVSVAYITSVGLYSPDNELVAVAKLSEPLKKDPTNELTVRVRLDY